MKRNLKKALSVLFAAIMILSLAACGGNSTNSQPSQPGTSTADDSGSTQKELKKLSISHHPVLSGLPAYVALQKGFFEEEGLDVDMTVYISGASQMEALPSGSWACGGAGATAGCLGTIGYGLSLLGYVGWDGPIDIFVREDSDVYQAGQGHIDG